MSVYVGIDVHRKRSQVAVVTEDGQVQLNKNTVNGTEPLLRLIGDLPAGTPVAFEAAFGWSWLADLLEDYGFEAHLVHPLRCKAIASARLKNDLLTELPDVSAVQEAGASLRPIVGLSQRSRLQAAPAMTQA
jgi:transposase